MSDPSRHDHTKPTVAFVGLAVAAAAVMTAAMTDRGRDVVAAADLPTTSTAPDLATPPDRARAAQALPPFSIAALATLDVAPQQRPPRRALRRLGPHPTARAVPETTQAAASGPRAEASRASGAAESGGSGGSGGAGGSGGTAGTGGGGSSTAGPGRSETGKGQARGQRDRSPGKGKAAGSQRRSEGAPRR